MQERHVTFVLIVALIIVFIGGAAQTYGGGFCDNGLTSLNSNPTNNYEGANQ